MLGSVQFDNQFGLVAIEINNIISYDILSAKSKWVFAQKIVPQQGFFFCGGFSELAGEGFQFLVSFHGIDHLCVVIWVEV